MNTKRALPTFPVSTLNSELEQKPVLTIREDGLLKDVAFREHHAKPMGWLTAHEDPTFANYLQGLLDTEDTIVTLDLTHVRYLSETHFEVLASALTRAACRRMFIRILAPTAIAKRIRELQLDSLSSVILVEHY